MRGKGLAPTWEEEIEKFINGIMPFMMNKTMLGVSYITCFDFIKRETVHFFPPMVVVVVVVVLGDSDWSCISLDLRHRCMYFSGILGRRNLLRKS